MRCWRASRNLRLNIDARWLGKHGGALGLYAENLLLRSFEHPRRMLSG
jgi:hypothetical protein